MADNNYDRRAESPIPA